MASNSWAGKHCNNSSGENKGDHKEMHCSKKSKIVVGT